jgi:hypothetical protein
MATTITWTNSLEGALVRAQSEQRDILLDFTAAPL